MATEDRWLSVEEIAEHLGVSKESIYRWLERGRIPAHRVGCAVHVISSALTGRDGEPLVLVMSSKLSKVWKMASRSALRFSYTLFVPTCESRIAFVATV